MFTHVLAVNWTFLDAALVVLGAVLATRLRKIGQYVGGTFSFARALFGTTFMAVANAWLWFILFTGKPLIRDPFGRVSMYAEDWELLKLDLLFVGLSVCAVAQIIWSTGLAEHLARRWRPRPNP